MNVLSDSIVTSYIIYMSSNIQTRDIKQTLGVCSQRPDTRHLPQLCHNKVTDNGSEVCVSHAERVARDSQIEYSTARLNTVPPD